MRKHADWMAQLDDRILEALRDLGPRRRFTLGQELAAAGGDMNYPQYYFEHRTAKLTTHGLIDCGPDGRFALTEAGERYLDGSLDASTLDAADADDPEADGDSKEFIV